MKNLNILQDVNSYSNVWSNLCFFINLKDPRDVFISVFLLKLKYRLYFQLASSATAISRQRRNSRVAGERCSERRRKCWIALQGFMSYKSRWHLITSRFKLARLRMVFEEFSLAHVLFGSEYFFRDFWAIYRPRLREL